MKKEPFSATQSIEKTLNPKLHKIRELLQKAAPRQKFFRGKQTLTNMEKLKIKQHPSLMRKKQQKSIQESS